MALSELLRAALRACEQRFPSVELGSYPSFEGGRGQVELVLKCNDRVLLAEALAWLEEAVSDRRPLR